MSAAVRGVVAVLGDRVGERQHGSTPALMTVGNVSLLGHALRALDEAGAREVAVVTPVRFASPIARELQDLQVQATPRLITRERVRGPGDALRIAHGFIGRSPAVLLLAGAIVRSVPAVVKAAAQHDTAAIMLAHAAGTGDNLRLEHRRLLRFAASVCPDRKVDDICGVVLGAGIVERVFAARPNGRELTELLRQVQELGGDVVVDVTSAAASYAGRPSDLLRLNRIALEMLPERETVSLPGVRLEGAVEIHPTAEIESSVLRGPVIVGAGARIADAYVGPFTSIGADVRIEGAEIEHSIILPGAEILHIGSRLEASIVGRDARIYRDFSLPRAMRLQVGDSVEVALC